MTTKTAHRPGTLVGFLHYDQGTCLAYGVVVSHDTEAGRLTVRKPDGREFTVSDHPDFVEAHTANTTCGKCGADVWRNLARGAHERISDVDLTGSVRCPADGFHGRA